MAKCKVSRQALLHMRTQFARWIGNGAKARLGIGMALIMMCGLASCNLSRPPAILQTPAAHFLKFVAIARQGNLNGYFSLCDAATNQVAADGALRIQVFSTANVSMGSSDGKQTLPGAMKLKTTFYDNAFAVGASNFHWESFGSFIRTHDLYFRFTIPYANFKLSPPLGNQATVQLDFTPKNGTNVLSVAKNVMMY